MKRQQLAILLGLLITLISQVSTASARPGDLDLSYSQDGLARMNRVGWIFGFSSIFEPDGRYIIHGYDYSQDEYFKYRINTAGELDPFFDSQCISESGGDLAAIQPDGKRVKINVHQLGNGSPGFGITRYNSDCNYDLGFGLGGYVALILGPDSRPSYVTVQPDGKIIILGVANGRIAFARLNPNGSLDGAFGTSGFVFSENAVPLSPVFLPNGKFLIASTAGSLYRFTINGQIDTAFGSNGIVRGLGYIDDIGIQSNGKVIAMTWLSPGISQFKRYNEDGTPDLQFGDEGSVTFANLRGFSFAIQDDDKFLVIGLAYNGNCIVRFTKNGFVDRSFGDAGNLTLNSATLGSFGLILQPDGKFLVSGLIGPSYYDATPVVDRHLNDVGRTPASPDHDGDGRADLSVFRSSEETWYSTNSTQGLSQTKFGLASDKITPADYDGDGRTDIAVFREGIWFILNSSNNSVRIMSFGLPGDIPFPADYTGDARADLCVYRNGIWWEQNIYSGDVRATSFGLASDNPVAADYDADGKADQAVYRDGEWHLNLSYQGYLISRFGLAGDIPVPSDYDGDGAADRAVYRDGIWYIQQSSSTETTYFWGLSSDIPVPADYDGDGRSDAAVYRNGTWWTLRSTAGPAATQFGLPTDKPLASAYSY